MDCLAIFRTQMSVCGLFVFPHVVNHVSFERSMSLCSLLHRTFQVGYFFEKFGNIFSVTHTLQKYFSWTCYWTKYLWQLRQDHLGSVCNSRPLTTMCPYQPFRY